MRKIVLFSIALLVSLNTFAASHLGDSIAKTMNKQDNARKDSQSSSIFYGGKDISHPMVAAATETNSFAHIIAS